MPVNDQSIPNHAHIDANLGSESLQFQCPHIRHQDLALYHGLSRTGVGVGNLLGVPLLSTGLSG